MKKKVLALLLASSMIALTACSGSQDSPQPGGTTQDPQQTTVTQPQGSDGENQEVGLLNEDGYPIVNEPITLKVGVRAGNAALDGAWQDLTWIQELQKQSGINFEFVEYADAEAVSLMFASRDYPDISFNVGNDKQIADAAEGGDLYALDEYMEQYAPNWYNYFSKNPVSAAQVRSHDGHIYSFPMVWDDTAASGSVMRDFFCVAEPWITELGMQMPTTTEEFYQVLKAFKEHAGEGSIPENVIPLYIWGITNNAGGALDLITFFGLRVSSHRYCVTLDDNGKVEFNFANKEIIEPLKYIRRLVEEELIPVECFTDDNAAYMAKIKSADNYVGACFAGLNRDDGATVISGVLNAENGKQPLKRGIEAVITRNMFTVYKNCEYPEAAVRLANMIAEGDWGIQAYYGMFDGHFMEKKEDGTYVRLDYPSDEQRAVSSPCNRVAILGSKENIHDHLEYAEGSGFGEQIKAKDVYSPYLIPGKNCYPNLMFSEKNASRISELYTDLKSCIDTTYTNWMLNGGIEEGWDSYIAQMESYGMSEFLSLLQEEYDNAMGLAQ